MSQDSPRSVVRFPARPSRASRGALALAGPEHLGPTCVVQDFAWQPGRDRILALAVLQADGVEAQVDAIFTTPGRDGRVRTPPAGGQGWLRRGPERVCWARTQLGRSVIGCGGQALGRIERISLDHLRQRVRDLHLDDGTRIAASRALVLSSGELLIDESELRRQPVDLWLAWQQDLEEGRHWFDRRGLGLPPPLEPLRAAD